MDIPVMLLKDKVPDSIRIGMLADAPRRISMLSFSMPDHARVCSVCESCHRFPAFYAIEQVKDNSQELFNSRRTYKIGEKCSEPYIAH